MSRPALAAAMQEQHCVECWTEYVAGVPRCAHCGGPLRAGPLPERRPERLAAAPEPAAAPGPVAWRTQDPPDTELATLPGEAAETLARLLTGEGIPCLLVCQGIRRTRLPGEIPAEPIAVTLPVTVSVPRAVLAEARGLLATMDEDVIGEQWAGGAKAEASPDHAVPDEPGPRPPATAPGIRPERTVLPWALAAGLAALAAAVLGWVRF